MMIDTQRNIIFDQVQRVRERIANATSRTKRQPTDITLVAATKMNDVSRVYAAIEAGVDAVGENRVQELLQKYEQSAYTQIPLHFIGTLQTNKIRFLLGKVSLIQSVSSIRLGKAIAAEALKKGIHQNILLEVNIGQEESKSGIPPSDLVDAISILSKETNICICGLMAIPPISSKPGENIRYFDEMNQLFVDISEKKYDNVNMNILSMGMSNDYEDAIACGANMVRIGSAIFGARQY